MSQTKAQLIEGTATQELTLSKATLGAGTAGAPSLTTSGDTNTGVFFPAADTIAFAEGGAEAARFDSSGRLLVGTSTARTTDGTANRTLQVEDTSNYGVSVIKNSNDTFGGIITLAKSRGTTIGSNTVVQNGDMLGQIQFLGADGNDLDSIGARINAEVDGTPGSNDLPSRLTFSTTADGASSPTERMRITQTGRLYALTSSTDNGVTSAHTQGAGTTYELFQGRHSMTTIAADNGTVSFRVYTNGNVQNTNNSYAGISDVKLKENIVDAGSQWSDLKALQVRKYNFKEETGQQTHTQIGLIAQEVELVSPGLVTESPDRDEDGNDLGTATKSVNYSVLYMKAVKALQEAMERIEQLEQRLADAGIA